MSADPASAEWIPYWRLRGRHVTRVDVYGLAGNAETRLRAMSLGGDPTPHVRAVCRCGWSSQCRLDSPIAKQAAASAAARHLVEMTTVEASL